MKKTMIMRAAMVLCLVATMMACNETNKGIPQIGYLPVQLAGSAKWSIVNVTTGEVIAKDAFATMPSAVTADMFYVMNEDGTFNFYNVANPKTPVNKEPYGSVTAFSEDGLAVASKRGQALCVINKECEVVKELPREISQCSMFSQGYATYENDLGEWGFINAKGDTVIEAKFAQTNLFSPDGLAIVIEPSQVNDSTANYSVINTKGETVFTVNAQEYGIIQPTFIDGVLPVMKGDSLVCLDKKGNEVKNPNEDYKAVEKGGYKNFVRSTTGNYFVLTKDNKMGLVDKNNKVVIKAQYDRMTDLRNDRFIVAKDTLFSIIDDKGAPVGNACFVHAHGTNEAMFAARGFINIQYAVGGILGALGDDSCAGASIGTTVMDMNGAFDSDPKEYLDQNGLGVQQGPLIIQYMFDSPIAVNGEGGPTFNYSAKVMAVCLSMNLAFTDVTTEEQIVNMVKNNLGRFGFVLDSDEIFVSDAGNAIAMGYSNGILQLLYTSRTDAKPLPRNKRK